MDSRESIESNRPYDEVARERISAQGYGPASRHFLPYNQIGTPADVMAEEVRVFMGRRLDCAQCHNHPYENWSQDQFWGMAAFFGRLFRMGQVVIDHPANMDLSSKDVGGSIELLHPRTKALVKPALLDNSALSVAPDGNPRKELARWMTSHPYFAEAAVNRIWGHFFARGIVDPVDDFRSTNPPTHPELLAALAADFRSHGYDLRHLMKTIVSSRTYQLSHRPNATNRDDVTNYSRSLSRGLDAEVLLDAVVGRYRSARNILDGGDRRLNGRAGAGGYARRFNCAIRTPSSRAFSSCTAAPIAARSPNATPSRISARHCTCSRERPMSTA